MSFDPNAASPPNSGIFGLPYGEEEARLHYLPVPWQATTSYGGGTAGGPDAILAASRQVDLFDLEVERPYEAGLHLLATDPRFVEWSRLARPPFVTMLSRTWRICGSSASTDQRSYCILNSGII